MGKIICIIIFAFCVASFAQIKGTSQVGSLKLKKEITDKVPPEIILSEPSLRNGEELTTSIKLLKLRGKVVDQSSIRSLKINNFETTLNEDKSFSLEQNLIEGLNSFLITATDEKNNSSSFAFYINYAPKNAPPEITLLEPALNQNNEITIKEKNIVVRANIKDNDGIKEVTINNQKCHLLGKTEYYTNINLHDGSNIILIRATDKKGNTGEFTFTISSESDRKGPMVKILEPVVSRGIKVIKKSETVTIKGKAEDKSGVYEVSVNDIKSNLLTDGSFSLTLPLDVGDNRLVVKALDNNLNATIDTFIVTRKLENMLTKGRYFALVIGINSYNGYWPTLKCAMNDASEIASTIKQQYLFDSVITILDKNATRRNIIQKLEWLTDNLSPEDNLLIFYAGHGQFNKALNKGYWVPVDASSNSIADYIANSEIKTFLAGIRSKHTLLITDACFAGDIFRGGKTENYPFDPNNMERYYREVYRRQSRLALTSGGVEEVRDEGKEGHSIFTYYLLKALKDNKGKYMDASQLYNELRIAVTNNSDQTPMLQVVKDTYDEGGQFIFIRRDED